MKTITALQDFVRDGKENVKDHKVTSWPNIVVKPVRSVEDVRILISLLSIKISTSIN